MTEEMIEARVLQEKTRGLFDLLQRIHEFPPGEPLPLDEVAAFTQQVGMIFVGGLVARRPIFEAREDCHLLWRDDWYQERDLKDLKDLNR